MDDSLTYRGMVYPWQCDHMGHMNVMHYVGKFDEAAWNLFYRPGRDQRRSTITGTSLSASRTRAAASWASSRLA